MVKSRLAGAVVAAGGLLTTAACTSHAAEEPVAHEMRPPPLTDPVPVPLECDGRSWRVSSDVYFHFDSDELTAKARTDLGNCAARVARHLRTHGARVVVVGRADGIGPAAYNLDLSRRRAERVADALGARGVGDPRFDVVAAGEGGAEDGVANPDRRVVEVHLR